MNAQAADARSPEGPAASIERTWLRGVVLSITLAAAVLLGVLASQHFLDARGEPAGCFTLAVSKSSALVGLFALLILLTILGMVAGRLVNAVVGVFVLGAGLTALTLRSSSVTGAFFDGASFTALSIEPIIWVIPIAGAVLAIFRFAGAPPDIAPRYPGGSWREEFCDGEAIRAGLVALLVPLVVWLVVRNMLKGQALGGMCVGAIAVGIAYRLMAPRVQPLFAFIAPILVMGVYQLIVASRSPGDLGVAFATNSIPPELRVMPMDVVAGSLIGVAIGIGWARSFRRSDTIQS
ncbi:MAG: hypothetical protein EXS01_04595 [Phycisphaerales bacterium]|nr:hypothetical protein [Phycisphaerales bacterium]